MTRYLLSTAFIVLCVSTANAQDADICNNSDTPFGDRVAACERVLEGAANRVDALIDLGRVYEDADANAEAADYYSRALTLDSRSRAGLVRRGIVMGALQQWDAANSDLERLVDLYPDYTFGFYRLGWAYYRQHRYDDAISTLEEATRLNPDYYWSWYALGAVHSALDQEVEAGWAYREAARIRPFDGDTHLAAFRAFRRAGMPDEAAYHARLAHTLDPNQLSLRDWLVEDYMGQAPVPDLPPMPWAPPPEDREIRYFGVLAPVDTRDETQRAIEEMINFFGGRSYPMPETAAVMRVGFDPLDEIRFRPRMTVEHEQSETDRPAEPPARHFAMVPFEIQPPLPGAPLIEPRFDEGDPSDIWPLAAGNSLSGHGRYVVDCSQGSGFRYAVFGCLPDVEISEQGDFDWTMSVTTDRIQVPMGIFETYRLDVTMTARLTLLTVEREMPYTASFWIAPELGTWVASIFTVGDTYSFNQAMEIVPPVSAEE